MFHSIDADLALAVRDVEAAPPGIAGEGGKPGLAVFDDAVAPAVANVVASAIDEMAIDCLPNFRLEGPAALVADWLGTLSQTPALMPAQAWIVADVARQAARFAELTGTMHLSLKLEVVRDNACRRLHHDYVAHRLVCTYRGPGTQWLPRAHEAALGSERDTVPENWLRAIPRFAAALFAGRLLAGADPVLHRSPPITETGTVRLVLTINEPFSGRYRG